MGHRKPPAESEAPLPEELEGQRISGRVTDGYRVPAPGELGRSQAAPKSAVVSEFPEIEADLEFDEDSFLNEELEGDETCVAASAQTGVRVTVRPRQEPRVEFDDLDWDDGDETRLCEQDPFSGPTCRPAPLNKKTG